MRISIALICLVLVACQSAPGDNQGYADAQDLVDRIARETPNVVRLTIHAVPKGETKSIYIASTATERVGQPSDPEDIEALKTGRTIVKKEGGHVDVTVPIPGAPGKIFAVVGVTLANPEGASEQALRNQATAIAQKIRKAIAGAEKPLW